MDERIAELFGIAAGQRMTYEEALEYFQSKLALSPHEFFRLRARYRALAFTVSGYSSATVLKQFQDTLAKAIEDGTTLEQFRAGMNDWLKERGYRGVTPYQAENVFRTNLQTAYNVGAYRQMRSPAVLRDRPLLDVRRGRGFPHPQESSGHEREGFSGGFAGLGHMVPAQRLSLPLFGDQSDRGAGPADGSEGGDGGPAAGGRRQRVYLGQTRPGLWLQRGDGGLDLTCRFPREHQNGV